MKDKKKRSIPVSTGMTNKETGMTKDGLKKFGTKDNLKEKAGHIVDAQEIILIDKLINWSIRELVNISK